MEGSGRFLDGWQLQFGDRTFSKSYSRLIEAGTATVTATPNCFEFDESSTKESLKVKRWLDLKDNFVDEHAHFAHSSSRYP